jgi:adhesin transport system outer membrane protein
MNARLKTHLATQRPKASEAGFKPARIACLSGVVYGFMSFLPSHVSAGPTAPVTVPTHEVYRSAGEGPVNASDKTSAVVFSEWLEDKPEDFVKGPGPYEAELRQVFFRAIEQAVQRSPQVRLAMAEYEAALADVEEAKGRRLPQLDIGTQSKAARFGGGAEQRNGNSAAVSLNVVTTVYDWGRNGKNIESREQLVMAARQYYIGELETSAFNVSSSLVELGTQRTVTQVAQQYVDRMQSLVDMLSEIVIVDRGRASELTQAKARLLQAMASRDNAQARMDDAQLNLRKLVGNIDVPIPKQEMWSFRPADLPQLLSQIVDHPSIQQFEAHATASSLQADVVKAASLPKLDWVINKTTGEDALGREQPWQTMLSVSWGAFRGGLGQGRASSRDSTGSGKLG